MRDRLIKILQAYKRQICDGLVAKLPDVEALADHLLANGVIVPPCKVGQKVYYHSDHFKIKNPKALKDEREPWINEAKVDEIALSCFEDGELIIRLDVDFGCEYASTDFDISDFGKYVFLTREEAEAALAERSEK